MKQRIADRNRGTKIPTLANPARMGTRNFKFLPRAFASPPIHRIVLPCPYNREHLHDSEAAHRRPQSRNQNPHPRKSREGHPQIQIPASCVCLAPDTPNCSAVGARHAVPSYGNQFKRGHILRKRHEHRRGYIVRRRFFDSTVQNFRQVIICTRRGTACRAPADRQSTPQNTTH